MSQSHAQPKRAGRDMTERCSVLPELHEVLVCVRAGCAVFPFALFPFQERSPRKVACVTLSTSRVPCLRALKGKAMSGPRPRGLSPSCCSGRGGYEIVVAADVLPGDWLPTATDGGLWASEPISATMLESIECLYTFVGVHRERTQGACC